MKHCLRLKRDIKVCSDKHEVPSFLTQEEWKHAGEIEAILHNTFRLETIC